MGEAGADAADALVSGLPAEAPVGFGLVAGDGSWTFLSAPLAGAEAELTALLPELLAGTAPAELRRAGRDWFVTAQPLEDGSGGTAVVGVDVTDVHADERALRHGEALLRATQRMARVGWWRWRPRGDLLRASDSLLELLGLESASRVLDPDAWLGRLDPGERDALVTAARACVRTGEPLETRIVLIREGRPPQVLAVRGARTAPGELTGFAQDITEQDRAGARARAVAELGREALAGARVEELVERAADLAADTLWVERCSILEADPDGALVAAAVRPHALAGSYDRVEAGEDSPAMYALALGAPVVIEDWRRERRFTPPPALAALGVRSAAVVVVRGPERPWGVLGAVSSVPGRFGAQEVAFLRALANVLAEAVARRDAERQIAALSAARGRLVARVLDQEERTRREVAEAIHDGALQDLLAAGHDLYALEGAGAGVADVHARLSGVIRALRDALAALHPTVLQYGGLRAAVQAVAEPNGRAAGFAVEVDVEPEAAGVHDELLLSLARELLGNAAQHAGARSVRVAISRTEGGVALEVADDGLGATTAAVSGAPAHGGIGLAAARERVEALGGLLRLAARPGGGTIVRAELPS